MEGYRETQEWRDTPHRDKKEEIVIRFIIEYQDPDHRAVLSVAAEVFRAVRPAEYFRVARLKFDHNVPFQHVFSDGQNVHGWLRWRTGLHVTYDQQIIGRVETGNAGEPSYWNYDGFMIGFGSARPYPDPKPRPQPVEPDVPLPEPLPVPAETGALIVEHGQGEMTELFPFVYIKPWPKLASSVAEQGFMRVPADVRSSPFYTGIAGSTSEKKLTNAVAFIDDTLSPETGGAFSGQFLAPGQPLPAPFHDLAHFPESLCQKCSDEGLNRWVDEKFGGWDNLSAALETADASSTLINIWNSIIALAVTLGYDHVWLAELIRLLQAVHLVQWVLAHQTAGAKLETVPTYSSRDLTRTIQAVLVLPDDIFPVAPPPPQADPPAIQPYAVGAIRAVHYIPEHYVLGDVQRIEIVTAGETRQEVRRNLHRAETFEEDRQETGLSTTSACDTTTADLIDQVQKTLSERVSSTTVKNYETDYGQPTTNSMTVTGNWWVQDQPAGGYLKDVSKFARDVIERSVKVLRQESLNRRKSRLVEEAEITETRTLANPGDGDRQTVFRWVNRQYRLRTKASEDRLVFEMFVDAPGSGLAQALSKYCNIEAVAPVSPEQLGITSFKDLSPDSRNAGTSAGAVYYLDAFEVYGIPPDDCAPPATQVVSTGGISQNPISNALLEMPPGYSALTATATITSSATTPQVQVTVGGVTLTSAQSDGVLTFKGDLSSSPGRYGSQLWSSILCVVPPAAPTKSEPAADSTQPTSEPVATENTASFQPCYAFTLQIQCVRSPATLANWQMATFQKIAKAYEQACAKYRAALLEQKKRLDAKNPLLLADIVQDQIVKAAIALFVSATHTRPPNTASETDWRGFEPRYVQFLANAFEWKGIAITLFPEPDAGHSFKANQDGLLDLFSSKQYFRDFLNADHARLLISVKPDFARSLLLAFRTGQIWPAGEDIAPCMESDTSIVELLLDQKAESVKQAEDDWTITVPTEMVALSRHDPFS